jgi:hypothetical protein
MSTLNGAAPKPLRPLPSLLISDIAERLDPRLPIRATVVEEQHFVASASRLSIWLAKSAAPDNNAPPSERQGRKAFVFRQRISVCLRATIASAAAIAVTLLTPTARAADGPFPELVGTWSGSGVAKFDSGKKESLRCKGYYTNAGGPHNLGISIRCANASAKVELRATLVDTNGNVTGSWEERTYNQSGSVTGHAYGNKLNLSISGGITGSMLVTVGHGTHSVAVLTSGPSLKGINISMTR